MLTRRISSLRLVGGFLLGLSLHTPTARANGRMPGATELSLSGSDPSYLLARATYGLVQSFDRGASWSWICEQAIDVSGETDPPLAPTADGSLILLPLTGSTLISRDRGCSWSSVPGPLQDRKAVDLTHDPGDHGRVLVVTSTVDTIDSQGLITYENVLVETRDSGARWSEIGKLRSDFKIETIEVAASDPRRIYVSGTASENPLIGVIERSEDGGQTWVRTTLDLPPTSGSLFISAIDPHRPDRLWVRVPANGDRFGLFPAMLLMSNDKGASFAMLAGTTRGMLGFALSPDGTQLSYGGPADGLFVGPADGGGEFVHVSDLSVRCVRWTESGMYVCGTEPNDPFSIGISTDSGASFQPIYRMRDTCPQECAVGTPFASRCEQPWRGLEPRIATSSVDCAVTWAKPELDAGVGNPVTAVDAGAAETGMAVSAGAAADAGIPRSVHASNGCAVRRPYAGARLARCLLLSLLIVVRARWFRGRAGRTTKGLHKEHST